jgi:SNF2 family DNA or RNA helicase
MGLGKTIQVIGLILANRPPATRGPHCTLIVAPNELVMENWKTEIDKAVVTATLAVAKWQ